MSQKKAGPTPEKIDLGIIRVVSQGMRDMVYLAHNNLKAFTLSCAPGKASKLQVSREFMAYPETQWRPVFEAYASWKRKQMPDFKLPNHSGLRKDGQPHPWRERGALKKRPKATPILPPDDVFDFETDNNSTPDQI